MTEVPVPRTPDQLSLAAATPAPQAVVPPGRFGVRVVRPAPTATVIEVTGELDAATVRHFLDVVEPRLASVVRTLVVDLSAVTSLDSAGLRALRRCVRRAAATGQGFVLITGPRRLFRALETGEFAYCLARTAETVA
ncbi:STAS domain-containing protein [Amycolatopsis minnesotensis]|uniref:STAS domain-containing protein n=1 Tax=Amycolatopsis minnesotensis TaxID=337894 RepID=A0ABP5C3C5_9PSEU